MAFFSEAGLGAVKTDNKNNRIPTPIWRRCHRELEMYELHKKALTDLKAEIIEEYGSPNRELHSVPTGKSSIYYTGLDKAIAKLTGAEIMELERRIQVIEDVIVNLNPVERKFFDLHYRKHLNIVECAKCMAYSRESVTRIKRRVIEKMAARMGYII